MRNNLQLRTSIDWPAQMDGVGRCCRVMAAAMMVLLALCAGKVLAEVGNVEDPPQLVAFDIRIAGDELRTRIVIEFEQKPEYSYHLLASPARLVLDLPDTVFGFDESTAKARGLMDDIRYGRMAPGRSRIVFSSVGPMKVEMADVIENEADDSFRLVLDIAAVSDQEFGTLVIKQDWQANTVEVNSVPLPRPGDDDDKPFIVAIDPGHGGIDAGAKGRNGAQEKEITLALAKTLKSILDVRSDTRAILTRTDDRFVSLSERVRVARQHGADLFVSIHADSIRLKKIRGATVYTLSDKASDKMAQQLATRENRSDLIAGLSLDGEPEGVADILIDLTRRETQVFSINLARSVVGTFDGTIKLINNPHRSAGFRVLRALMYPLFWLSLVICQMWTMRSFFRTRSGVRKRQNCWARPFIPSAIR